MNTKHRPHEEPIFADERQQQIADLVVTHGKVRTAELTSLFGMTEPTLRKDLSVLEERGLLKRTHGGAVSFRDWGSSWVSGDLLSLMRSPGPQTST